jgi:hypothetical protein
MGNILKIYKINFLSDHKYGNSSKDEDNRLTNNARKDMSINT